MPGVLVEYGRFIEVQERRLRIIAELEWKTETLMQQSARTAVGEGIAHLEPVTSLDEMRQRELAEVPYVNSLPSLWLWRQGPGNVQKGTAHSRRRDDPGTR